MSALVEKMARAIDPSQWDNFDGYCSLKEFNAAERAEEMAASPSLQSSLDRALKALKAMRDEFRKAHSEPALKAACMNFYHREGKPASMLSTDDLCVAFIRQIDTAIQEHSTTPPRNAS